MAMLAHAFDLDARAHLPSARALLRNGGGVIAGIALGLLTLGASGAASYEQPTVPMVPVMIPAAPFSNSLAQAQSTVAAQDAPLRIRGRVGDGLYASLLEVGVAPAEAAEFLRIVARRLNLTRDIGADDNFDLVLAPGAAGERTLYYAAIERPGASDVEMMRWSVDGRFDWLDAGTSQRGAVGSVRPVAGRVSSGYGMRFHPILHFTRLHQGVDYAARAGTPIAATSDGIVTRAGWAGGYGRQVRIDHGGGMATSYSHMSGFAVAPGGHVRAGQVIGYVGSSGLSTGAHLHYEVFRGGIPVNPALVHFGRSTPLLGGPELARFQARFGQIMTLAIQPPRRG